MFDEDKKYLLDLLRFGGYVFYIGNTALDEEI